MFKIFTLILALVAVWLVAESKAAEAHNKVDVRHAQGATLEGMIAADREAHGVFPTFPSLSTSTAVVSIQQANWHEKRFTKSISGEPFQVWSAAIFGPNPRGIIIARRCHIGGMDSSWKPSKVYRYIKRTQRSRAIMRLPFWVSMSVRSMVGHAHTRGYAGKGTCQSYYVVFAASLLRKT